MVGLILVEGVVDVEDVVFLLIDYVYCSDFVIVG